MSVHMERAIGGLKKKILALGACVEESLRLAVDATVRRDRAMAEKAIKNDSEIDQMEVDIEEECLKILALYHPVATDLRYIVATLKINNDLERIGDVAVNIAERAVFLSAQEPPKIKFDFHKMGKKSQAMVTRSLDALVNVDTELARQVCAEDDEVDDMNRDMYIQVQEAIRQHPEDVEPLIHLLGISRHLERAADLASNIAEDIIYMRSGEIVRHRVEEYLSNNSAS